MGEDGPCLQLMKSLPHEAVNICSSNPLLETRFRQPSCLSTATVAAALVRSRWRMYACPSYTKSDERAGSAGKDELRIQTRCLKDSGMGYHTSAMGDTDRACLFPDPAIWNGAGGRGHRV